MTASQAHDKFVAARRCECGRRKDPFYLHCNTCQQRIWDAAEKSVKVAFSTH